MQADIVFTGLCAFLNADGQNTTMGDPAVIAVQTPNDNPHHIPFLAFNSTEVTVDNDTGFVVIPQAQDHKYLELGTYEIEIDGQPPAQPTVTQSYFDYLLRKDDYWPEAKDSWDRKYVPKKGDKPSRDAVKFYMRFGAGTLRAGRIALVRWYFQRRAGAAFAGNFAEEVVYSFTQAAGPVIIKVLNLADGTLVRTLKFDALSNGNVTLFLGNNTISDMATAVARSVTVQVKDTSGEHFMYLNAIAGQGDGPTPVGINPFPGGGSGGGENGAPCGPMSGDN